jgi:parallel beta-helix repeat protein
MNKLKNMLSLLAIACLLVGLIIYQTTANISSTHPLIDGDNDVPLQLQNVTTMGSPYENMKECSYLIGQTGSYTYMINGTTGRMVSYSTNALTVSQNAVGNLTSGGSVYWQIAQYNFAGCVNVTVSNITLYGSGWGTIFNETSRTTPCLFYVTGSNVVVKDMALYGIKDDVELGTSAAAYMSNLMFNGTSGCKALNVYSAYAPLAGIAARWSSNWEVDHCYVYDCVYNDTEYGHDTTGDGCYGIGFLSCWNVTISNSWVVDSGLGGVARAADGIGTDYTATAYLPYGISILDNHVITPRHANVTMGARGIYAQGRALVVTGNYVMMPSTQTLSSCIVVGSGTNTSSSSVVSGNTFVGSTGANCYAADISSNAPYTVFTGNTISNTLYGVRTQSSSSTITGNSIVVTGAGGGVVLGGSGGNSLVQGNTIVQTSSTGTGIIVVTEPASIEGNTITGSFTTGITLSNRDNSTVTGNIITSSTTGISLTSGSIYNAITSNRISCTTGINEASGADYNTFTSNILVGSTTGVVNFGLHSTWHDNAGLVAGLDTDASIMVGTVGETVALGNLVFLNSSGYFKTNAVSTTKMPAVAMASQANSTGGVCILLLQGYFTNAAWSWTPGALLYASNTTAGGMTHTYPSNSGAQVEVVGYAVSATQIYFDPQLIIITIA